MEGQVTESPFSDVGHLRVHALWEARHVSAGVTCEWPDCPVVSSVSVGGHSWNLKMRPLDAEIFALFGLPALENGMTLAEVAAWPLQ